MHDAQTAGLWGLGAAVVRPALFVLIARKAERATA